jgi:hypothetical protein
MLMSLLITNQVIVDLHDSVIEPAAWKVATTGTKRCASP